MITVVASVAVGATTIGIVLWKMGAGFTRVEEGLGFLSKTVNNRFDRNDAEHEEIFGRLRTDGEDIAVLKSQRTRSDKDISAIEDREREE
jgi:hypothetical protein